MKKISKKLINKVVDRAHELERGHIFKHLRDEQAWDFWYGQSWLVVVDLGGSFFAHAVAPKHMVIPGYPRKRKNGKRGK